MKYTPPTKSFRQDGIVRYGASERDVRYCGRFSLVENKPVAIIGTRTPFSQAKEAAFRIAEEMQGSGVAVATGLAAGSDWFAAQAAMKYALPLVGWIATGLDRCTPVITQEGHTYAWRHGCLLSLRTDGSGIDSGADFVARNAPLVGTARSVIVLDATESSTGTRSAVRFAVAFGIPVFATLFAFERASWLRYYLHLGKASELKGKEQWMKR